MPEAWKEKIKTTQLVDRLSKHAHGEIKMENTQIRAADILLKKVIPDLARSEMTGLNGAPIETKNVTKTDAEILAQYLKQSKKE